MNGYKRNAHHVTRAHRSVLSKKLHFALWGTRVIAEMAFFKHKGKIDIVSMVFD